MMTLLDTEQSYVDSLKTLIQVQQLSLWHLSFFLFICVSLSLQFFILPSVLFPSWMAVAPFDTLLYNSSGCVRMCVC